MDSATSPVMSERARATAAHYRGDVARKYEAKRLRQEKWGAEHKILTAWLASFPVGSTVLDVPFGTGRFSSIYHARQFHVVGRDISKDMIAEAMGKCLDMRWDIAVGNVLALDLPNGAVDVAVCIRLLNMIEPDEMQRALAEMQRVAVRAVIVSLRVGGEPGVLTRPQTVADVAAALAPGWRIAEDRPVHKPRYRMIRLEMG